MRRRVEVLARRIVSFSLAFSSFEWSSTKITEAEKREKRDGTVVFRASADSRPGAADRVV